MQTRETKRVGPSVYLLPVLFFLFIALYAVADMAVPDRRVSELENRTLAQAPAFSAKALMNNEWTLSYTEYVKDQFLFRDEWVSLQSLLEVVQGKLEIGGVWLADDGFLVAKDEVLTGTQAKKIPVNTAAVAEFAQRHPGRVSVMIVPSPANILSDLLPFNPQQIGENAFLDEMFAQFAAAGANAVDLRAAFEADQANIFYRTDPHWTTTGGARIAYEEFCRSLGVAPGLPDESLLRQIPNYLGTNFSKSKVFNAQADTLAYYDLPNQLTIYKSDGAGGMTAISAGPLMDQSKFATYDKYGAFLFGNNGYSEIQGNGTGSILLIKDSFGNCFAPYLIENYAKIGIMDLRGWAGPDATIESAGGFDEILVLYSFPAFSIDMFAYLLSDAMQK